MRKIELIFCFALIVLWSVVISGQTVMTCDRGSDGRLHNCRNAASAQATATATANATVVVRNSAPAYQNSYVESNDYPRTRGVIQNVNVDFNGRRVRGGYSATIVSGNLGPLLIGTNGGYYNRGYGRYDDYDDRYYRRNRRYDDYDDYYRRGRYDGYYGRGGYNDPYAVRNGRYSGYGRYNYPNYGNNRRYNDDCYRNNNRRYRRY